MNTVMALAAVVLKEMYRRKDFYVLFVLTALVTLVMGAVNFFNDQTIIRYLKDICLVLIWISALVIAIATAARQIPSEQENRTIYPLLAKPVTRGQVILGKFAGCWLACGLALVVFYVFLGAISASREHQWPVLVYLQGLWRHWIMLGVVVALVILGSVVFTAPSSNATISFIVVSGLLWFAGHLNQVALQQPEPLRTLVYAIYFLIPHLEWFDAREFIVFNHELIPWTACAIETLYAAIYAALLLLGAWMVFRKKALSK